MCLVNVKWFLVAGVFWLSCQGSGWAQDDANEKSIDWSGAKELERGILHVRQTLTEPRKMVVNCLRVDATTPGIRFHTTKQFGADTAINMDGGGSTTLVWWDPQSAGDDHCRLLNVPTGNGNELKLGDENPTERVNGNNFGVYFQLR